MDGPASTAPVVIRGQAFATVEGAATHFGIKPETVRRAIRAGRADSVGMPSGRRPGAGAVTVRGVTYESASAVAAAFGVRLISVRRAIRLGKLDTLGLGAGSRVRMPVRIRGQIFPDYDVAAAALGVSARSLRMRMLRGTIDGAGLAAANPRNGAKPVTFGGLSWPSQAEACRQLGLSQGYIAHYRRHRLAATRMVILRAVMAVKARQEASAAADADLVDRISIKRVAGQPARAGAGCTTKRAA